MGNSDRIRALALIFCIGPLTITSDYRRGGVRCEVEVSSIEEQLRDWALQTGIAANQQAGDRLVAMGLAAWAARALPQCAGAELVLATQWTTFICVLDDFFDCGPEPLAPDAVKAVMKGLLGVLTETPPRRCTSPLQVALSDLWQRTAAGAPRSWRQRFVVHYTDFAAVSWEEACVRESGTELDLVGYLQMRRRSITMLPLLDIAEHLCDIHLPGKWRQHEAVRVMKSSAIEAVGCANDLCSPQEDNLVSVIARQNSCSVPDAYRQAREIVNAQLRLFDGSVSYFEELRSPYSAVPGFPVVWKYANMLRDLLYGTLAWLPESARYEGPTGIHSAQS